MTSNDGSKYIVGTSGYSFADWVGTFYPPGTSRKDMLECYTRCFPTVELNFSFYRMPTARTLEGMARRTRPDFTFWVKANRQLTHDYIREPAPRFIEALWPLRDADKLAGVLLQFPQSFHRTVANRKYLAGLVEDFQSVPLAVEFRHGSWEHPSTVEGLAARDVTLVIPDVPEISSLYRAAATVTSRTGYLRLHSRRADLWYAGAVERYDYSYSEQEMRELLAEWAELEDRVDRVYALFNNCHRGQAADNAEAFRRLLGQL